MKSIISNTIATAAIILMVHILFLSSQIYAENSDFVDKQNATGNKHQYGEYDWFWWFYEKDYNDNYQSRVYRPFYMIHIDKKGIFDASLMPIIFWRYRTEKQETWKGLFSFIISTNYTHDDGIKDYDLGIFPFLYFGTSKEKRDKYFLLWPFGGTLKGKFGYEKISAYIFPGFLLFVFFPPASLFSFQTTAYVIASLLPLYVNFQQKEYRAHSIFWPLIMWGKGPGRRDIRILPFYSHLHKDRFYDKYNVLLLFNYQRTYYKNDEHKTFFFFPVFGAKWSRSGRMGAVTFFWPFFSWGYDRRSGDRQYNFPWPLFQIQDCESPSIVKRIFFPFYGYYRYLRNKTIFVTPLYFRLIKRSSRFDSDYFINFFIFWYFKRDYHGSPHSYYGNRWRYFKIWPLFQVEYNDQGDVVFNMLSLLPMRDPDGYEKLYQPLWTLVEYRRFRNGEQRLGLFFRLYYQRWGDNFFQMKIPFVISFEKRNKKITEFYMFMSMFGYKEKKKGRYIRIFWIPIPLKKSESSGPEMAHSEEDEIKPHYSCYMPNGYYADKIQVTHGLY